jgi:hypothetical protein
MIIILPDQTRVDTTQVLRYYLVGTKLSFDISGANSFSGGITSFTAQYDAKNQDNANYLFSQVDAIYKAGQPGTFSLTPTHGVVLQSVSPQMVFISNTVTPGDSDDLIISGLNFTRSMEAGNIHVEDLAGGTDSNAAAYAITYINPTTITATLVSTGDQILTAPNIVYYEAADGTQSNTLPITITVVS